MKFYQSKFYLSFLMIGIINCFMGQVPINDPTWLNTFFDDFNGNSGPSSLNWNIGPDWRSDVACVCYDSGPSTLDFKTKRTNTDYIANPAPPNNSSFGTIVTKKQVNVINGLSYCGSQPFINPTCGQPAIPYTFQVPYTSLQYLLSKKFFRYGYFETRFKLPQLNNSGVNSTNNGLGANFWLNRWDSGDLNGDGGIYYSEIDVMEILGSNTQGNNPAKHQWGNNSHIWPETGICQSVNNPQITGTSLAGNPAGFQIPNDGSWHKLSANWSPNRIDFYFDDVYLNSSYNYPWLMDAMRMILDVNVFKTISGDATTYDPYNYDIDFVKVYGLNVSQIYNCFHNTPSGLTNSVYKCITLGNPYTAIISSLGANAAQRNLRATDYILLDTGFELNAGIEFYAETMTDPSQTIY